VVFSNAFTATTECCPSRASLLTSSYPTEHGVKTTPGSLDPGWDLGADGEFDVTKGQRPNLLRLLSTHQTEDNKIKQLGYDVGWKGKWHLSHFHSRYRNQCSTTEASMLKWYGATSPWNPPDAGHSLSHPATLGGGRKFNHDGRYLRGLKKRFDGDDAINAVNILVDPYRSSDDDCDDSDEAEEECIFDFLAKHTLPAKNEGDDNGSANSQQSSDAKPFFLVASLVNPHDVWASSCFSHLTDEEFYKETGYHPRDFESIPIVLPPNHKDDLSTKPLIQSILNDHHAFGDLPDKIDQSKVQRQSDALRYIRFYAFLHKAVDAEIGSLLDALDATGQMDNTIILRMADHGEQALSHGLREKRMQCYEETIRIPLVINYPAGWFDDNTDNKVGGHTKKTNSCLVSSIDILPTIAELAGIDCSSHLYRGKSLVPFLRNENSDTDDVKNEILFTFDEPLAPPGVPGFIRCIRTPDYKYAVYFTVDGETVEYEMYNLSTDPYEMSNLCGPDVDPDDCWYEYHERLTLLMVKMGAFPSEFDWIKMRPRRYSWV
jgi:arylsulfatase A-like enzyme